MRGALCVLAITLSADLGACLANDVPASVAEERDLRTYDDGGVYRLPGYIEDRQRLHEFIWNHWTQKRRGYVEVVFQGIDAGTQAYIFIEPSVDKRWGIAWYDIRYSALPGAIPGSPTSSPTIRTVEHCRGYLIFFDENDNLLRYL